MTDRELDELETPIGNIMSLNPQCCGLHSSMQEVAQLMSDEDCGEIPVVDGQNKLIGVITDRDIVCRGVAQGKRSDAPIQELMTAEPVVITQLTTLRECLKTLEAHDIRRLPVVDEHRTCCGIVSQADIARYATNRLTGELVRDISTEAPMRTV